MKPRFVPIDAGARTGRPLLLKDAAGHQHCGLWSPAGFTYPGGHPIALPITHYAKREAR